MICPICDKRPVLTSLGLCAWCDNTQGEDPSELLEFLAQKQRERARNKGKGEQMSDGDKNKIRLACSECDRSDCDFITEEKLKELERDWEDVTFFQSYEDSIRIYDSPRDAPASYRVLDWFTHIGLCPDCKKEREWIARTTS